MQKLVYINGKLQEWNKTTYSCLGENKEKFGNKLQCIDSLLEGEDWKLEDLRSERREVLPEMERVLKAEEIFWASKSKE